jgi:hypothetical protein
MRSRLTTLYVISAGQRLVSSTVAARRLGASFGCPAQDTGPRQFAVTISMQVVAFSDATVVDCTCLIECIK